MNTNMMECSKFIKWSVAGDGCVSYATHNKNAHYSITRSPEHLDYIEAVANKISKIPDVEVVLSRYVRKDNDKEVLSLRTNSHPIFTRIRNRQYVGNHRVIDPHMLTVVDWETLAYLYMDDGSLSYNNKGTPVVRISTCAYSYFEQYALRKAFAEKLDVVFNVNKVSKGLYQLYLSTKSHDKFFRGIKPFIVKSYAYKLPLYLQEEAPTVAEAA